MDSEWKANDFRLENFEHTKNQRNLGKPHRWKYVLERLVNVRSPAQSWPQSKAPKWKTFSPFRPLGNTWWLEKLRYKRQSRSADFTSRLKLQFDGLASMQSHTAWNPGPGCLSSSSRRLLLRIWNTKIEVQINASLAKNFWFFIEMLSHQKTTKRRQHSYQIRSDFLIRMRGNLFYSNVLTVTL